MQFYFFCQVRILDKMSLDSFFAYCILYTIYKNNNYEYTKVTTTTIVWTAYPLA